MNGVNYFPARLKEVIAFCRKQFPDEPLRILDVGCGRYTHLQPVADIHPPVAIYGMDIAKSELDRNEFLIISCMTPAVNSTVMNSGNSGVFSIWLSATVFWNIYLNPKSPMQ